MKPTTGLKLDVWDASGRGRAGALKSGRSYQLTWRDGSTSPALINIGEPDSAGNITIWSETSAAGVPSCN